MLKNEKGEGTVEDMKDKLKEGKQGWDGGLRISSVGKGRGRGTVVWAYK